MEKAIVEAKMQKAENKFNALDAVLVYCTCRLYFLRGLNTSKQVQLGLDILAANQR
jgi:hypothetical protein